LSILGQSSERVKIVATLQDSPVGTFRAGFTGTVIVPDDPSYDTARSVWNGDIDRRPAVIARCSNADEVAAALRFGREQGLEISVRGGGHNFAGFAVRDNALMIDLSAMRQVTVNPSTRRAVCGGGATWGDLDAVSQAHGLAVPGGVVSHTGIAGLTLGGGIGWLTRKAGLSADNLVSAEVVTADGTILRASPTENADLFWAIRGGGGNFGVVTTFEYRLHEVGPLINFGLFFWGVDQGVEALRFCRDFIRAVPENFGLLIVGTNAPSEPFVPREHHGVPGYALIVVGYGSAEEHARVVQPIRETISPVFELVAPMPYTSLQQFFDESYPWGILGYEKALYLDDLTDAAIAVFAEHFPRKSSAVSEVALFVVDGSYARVGDDDTAFGGSRAARIVFNILAVAPTPDLLQADRAWVRSFWDALRPHASSSGSYVNFMTEYEENRVRAAYGPAKYDRLARLKARYDPDNVFHLNANIKPSP
jgi:FAD binding domain/Berberine and berberine like